MYIRQCGDITPKGLGHVFGHALLGISEYAVWFISRSACTRDVCMVFYVNPRTVTISWIEPAYSLFFWFDDPAVHGTSMYPVGNLNWGPTSMSKAHNASRGTQFVGLDAVSCRNSEKFVLKLDTVLCLTTFNLWNTTCRPIDQQI